MNTATLISQPQVELDTLIPFSKGWNDGYFANEWLPVYSLSSNYMAGYRSGWLAKLK